MLNLFTFEMGTPFCFAVLLVNWEFSDSSLINECDCLLFVDAAKRKFKITTKSIEEEGKLWPLVLSTNSAGKNGEKSTTHTIFESLVQ